MEFWAGLVRVQADAIRSTSPGFDRLYVTCTVTVTPPGGKAVISKVGPKLIGDLSSGDRSTRPVGVNLTVQCGDAVDVHYVVENGYWKYATTVTFGSGLLPYWQALTDTEPAHCDGVVAEGHLGFSSGDLASWFGGNSHERVVDESHPGIPSDEDCGGLSSYETSFAVRAPAGVFDPIPTRVTGGKWPLLADASGGRTFVRFTTTRPLVLEFDPGTGAYRVWEFYPNAAKGTNPLSAEPIDSGVDELLVEATLLWYERDWFLLLSSSGEHRLIQWDETQAPDGFGALVRAYGDQPLWPDGYAEVLQIGYGATTDRHAGPDTTTARFLQWEPFVESAQGSEFLVWHRPIWIAATESNRDTVFLGPETRGRWKSINGWHNLVPLGYSRGRFRVLDWVPSDRSFRVWGVDALAAGSQDPIPDLLAQGCFRHLGEEQRLFYLGDPYDDSRPQNLVLEWTPATGDYTLWEAADF